MAGPAASLDAEDRLIDAGSSPAVAEAKFDAEAGLLCPHPKFPGNHCQ
jgi:hypothetical protein